MPEWEVIVPMVSAPKSLTARHVASRHLQCGRAVHSNQISVTVSRGLMADHAQLMKDPLGAWLEVAPV